MKVIKPNTLELLECSVSESDSVDGVLWDASTSYAKDQKVRYEHVVYQSLAGSNKGNKPSETWSGIDAKWKKIGATFPWLMLDDFVNTMTTAPEGEKLTFTVPFSRANAFCLVNLQGSSVKVKVIGDGGEVDYEGTYEIIKDIEGFSLYAYDYDLIESVDSIANTDVPISLYGTLSVEIDPGGPGSVAGVGHVIVGRARTLGQTLYDAEVGITDYSRKETDEFGVTSFVRRSFAKRASLELYLHPSQSDFVAATLQELRATPSLWIGDNVDNGYTALTIYGWVEDWRSVYSGPNEQQLSVDIQGLI